MTVPLAIDVPDGFDWRHWVERWDRMQDLYVPGRQERMELMVRTIRATQQSVGRVLDLGCGAGSLTVALLEAFPQARVFGIDFDPTMILLAKERLARFGDRAVLALADLRDAFWCKSLPAPMDATVSITALHWLTPQQLSGLYRQLAEILRPGGILLNSDHVGSDLSLVQKLWKQHAQQMRQHPDNCGTDDWEGFWNAYAEILNLDINEIHKRVIGSWEGGVEEGLPLAWHFDQMRARGFVSVDCFWRSCGDAIYGGICGQDQISEDAANCC